MKNKKQFNDKVMTPDEYVKHKNLKKSNKRGRKKKK